MNKSLNRPVRSHLEQVCQQRNIATYQLVDFPIFLLDTIGREIEDNIGRDAREACFQAPNVEAGNLQDAKARPCRKRREPLFGTDQTSPRSVRPKGTESPEPINPVPPVTKADRMELIPSQHSCIAGSDAQSPLRRTDPSVESAIPFDSPFHGFLQV